MANKITSKTAGNRNQILFDVMNRKAVSIIVDASVGIEDESTGRKIAKAGTPLAGDLKDRTEPFGSTGTVQGVLLYDVDVTAGNDNGSLLIWGFVNLDRLDEDVATSVKAQQEALEGKVWLLSDN